MSSNELQFPHEHGVWHILCVEHSRGKCEMARVWWWPDGFRRFLADVGPAPSDRHRLERVTYWSPSSGDPREPSVRPGNVRWRLGAS